MDERDGRLRRASVGVALLHAGLLSCASPERTPVGDKEQRTVVTLEGAEMSVPATTTMRLGAPYGEPPRMHSAAGRYESFEIPEPFLGLLSPRSYQPKEDDPKQLLVFGHTLRMDDPKVNGRLPQAEVQRIIRHLFGRFRWCFEDGLARDRFLEGRIEVRFEVDRLGYASNVTTAGFPDERVSGCVAHVYGIQMFPPPAGGGATVVSTLVFVPT